MEKNRVQAEEIRYLKLEQESEEMMLCEATKQKKKAMEDKAMIEEDKRIMPNRLEEKSKELTKIFNMQLHTLSEMTNSHHELTVKDIEITKLKL